MKTKLRIIAHNQNGDPSYGITIPHDIAIFIKGMTFDIEFNGTTMILKSGCDLRTIKREAINYNYNDIRIN